MIGSTLAARRARLQPLLEAARSIRDATSERGRRARERLVESSGLSPAGVDFALQRCLETEPSEAELAALLRSTEEAPAAHVLLSANVFVAAHRAIAIALAASPVVRVRSSRREPEMAELLSEGAPGAFQLQTELQPQAGDHVWAYGNDETLQSVARTLAPGAVLHAHGAGFGIGVVTGRPSPAALEQLLPALAEDIALFDQRGCLSPRVLLVTGGPEFAGELARKLAAELDAIEARIPRGRLAADEAAAITAYRDSASYAGHAFAAGLGFVSSGTQFLLPPPGRNLHVLATNEALESLAQRSSFVTSCAFEGDRTLRAALEAALPGARFCQFGYLQRPPFDGPVDRRKRAM
jgi:hypothetical protein